MDVNAIEGGHQPELFKRRGSLARKLKFLSNRVKDCGCNGRVRGSKCKIVHLAEQEDGSAIEMSNVDVALVSSRAKTKVM